MPSENVQMVSTQPELPVRCCTAQAPAISTDRVSAMAANASISSEWSAPGTPVPGPAVVTILYFATPCLLR